ncbi:MULTISPECIES: hypothetical protein [Corynebacterium]|uniref:hypothetical protein n=1 Tax=Corynebacterium TaxID=1716 RepID=UPI00195DCC82|nr:MULTISPECIES: hypothetical protein [Corynebacterium]MDN8624359.1 hypothetical protein [Corynebacterium kroppenstedtii]QRQ65356.1 hypothetical protein I6J23_02485 [Corynebacterium kroppenstedtii]
MDREALKYLEDQGSKLNLHPLSREMGWEDTMPYGDGSRTISANVDSIASSQRSTKRAAWASVMLQGMRLAQAKRHHKESLGELHHTQDQIDESIGELRNIQLQIERGIQLIDQRSQQLIATIEKSEDNQGYRDYAMWAGSTPEGKLYEYTYRPEAEKRIRFIAALNELWQRKVSIAFAAAVNHLSQAEQDLLLKGEPIYRDTEERVLPSPPNQDTKFPAKTALIRILYFALFIISALTLQFVGSIVLAIVFAIFGNDPTTPESGFEKVLHGYFIVCVILAVGVCFYVRWLIKRRKERDLQKYYNLLEQEAARLKHIDDLNVAKLNELIDQVSRELGFDISKIDEVMVGWNSNSAVARAASVAEFMENFHVSLPMARLWPPLPDKPIVSDFSQTKLAKDSEDIKSLVDRFDWRSRQEL